MDVERHDGTAPLRRKGGDRVEQRDRITAAGQCDGHRARTGNAVERGGDGGDDVVARRRGAAFGATGRRSP
jgi:hypothetical protein